MVGRRLGSVVPVGAVVSQTLVWTACLFALLSGGAAQAADKVKVVEPHYVLTEEHHHVVPHLVNFARQGVLRSHRNAPLTAFENLDGAVLVHLDSHADGNLPPHMDAAVRDELPAEGSETHDLLRHTSINDFLLLLGYMGIVEHIIFVEPPWSLLMKNVHFSTAHISIGVSLDTEEEEEEPAQKIPPTNEEGYPRMFASIRSPLEEEDASLYRTMMDEGVVLDHKDLVKRCGKIRTVRFTVIPYAGATQTLTDLLDKEDPEKDIILDVDLDGFGTTSPGAMAMHEAIPSYEDLMRIYHTVHDLCDMDPNYWQQVKDNVEPKCNHERGLHHGPPFRTDMPETFRISGKTKRRIHSLQHSEQMEPDTESMLEEILELYSSSITEHLKGKFTEKMDAFLVQPFHVDESTIEPIIDYWHQVLKAVFVGNRVPT
eukprot:scaffold33937_cov66-Attheya_sp.AAC.1